jgi:hypothetical protein
MPLLPKVVLMLALGATCLPALSAEGKWMQQGAQGTREFFIDKQGYRLLVICPTVSDLSEARSAVSLVKMSDGSDVGEFTIKVGKTSVPGNIEASNRLGDSTFLDALRILRNGDALISFGKQSITFGKSNAADILPSSASKLMCKLDFDTIFPPKTQ